MTYPCRAPGCRCPDHTTAADEQIGPCHRCGHAWSEHQHRQEATMATTETGHDELRLHLAVTLRKDSSGPDRTPAEVAEQLGRDIMEIVRTVWVDDEDGPDTAYEIVKVEASDGHD